MKILWDWLPEDPLIQCDGDFIRLDIEVLSEIVPTSFEGFQGLAAFAPVGIHNHDSAIGLFQGWIARQGQLIMADCLGPGTECFIGAGNLEKDFHISLLQGFA